MPYQHAITALEQINANCSIMSEDDFPKLPDFKRNQEEINNAIAYLKVANLGGLTALVSLVRQWGIDRQIIGPHAKATVQTQFGKLMEEVGEIADGISDNDQHEIIDGIGDATVVLILLAELAGVRFETCLQAAWDEIKDRTGSMQNGHFVKESPTVGQMLGMPSTFPQE